MKKKFPYQVLYYVCEIYVNAGCIYTFTLISNLIYNEEETTDGSPSTFISLFEIFFTQGSCPSLFQLINRNIV